MIKSFKEFGKKAILLSMGTIIILFSLEILLRLQFLVPPVFDNDGWWKWRWHSAKKTFSGDFTEFPDQFDPVLGWVPKNNFQTTDEYGKLSFNSAGIRSDKEYSAAKSGKKRIVTIGDSFTYGECVGDEQTYSAYLEQHLSETEVLNFGVHGYGLDQQLLRLKTALTYSPDLVIVGFYNPDITRILLSFREYLKPKFDLVEGKLVLTNSPLPPPEIYGRNIHLLVYDALQMYLTTLRDRIYTERKNQYETSLSSAILDEMAKITQEKGAKLYLLYLPQFDEVKNNYSTPYAAFTKLCQQNKAVCIDPTASLNLFIKSYPYPQRLFDCHYAKEVHAEIAKEVKKFIEK